MQMSGQLYASAAFIPRKEPPVPTGRRLVDPESQFGCGGEKMKPFNAPAGN